MDRALLVIGSVAYDTVETPSGSVDDALGGSALYASAAASLFVPVHLVGVVGTDFRIDDLDFMRQRRVDLGGLEVADGRTFRWSGVYEANLNVRHTRSTHLNVFADFSPRLPDGYRSDSVIFLGNIAPTLQAHVLDQLREPRWVALDTMDLWINTARGELEKVMTRVQMIIVNDAEARLLSGESNLVLAARRLMAMGPAAVVIKKGEHGVFLVTNDGYAALPALPILSVIDPTGAGDSFAGGMLGAIAASRDWSFAGLRRAMAYGTATASLAVESFSLDGLRTATRLMLEERYRWLRDIADIPEPVRADGGVHAGPNA